MCAKKMVSLLYEYNNKCEYNIIIWYSFSYLRSYYKNFIKELVLYIYV